jgi:hypothetical protein
MRALMKKHAPAAKEGDQLRQSSRGSERMVAFVNATKHHVTFAFRRRGIRGQVRAPGGRGQGLEAREAHQPGRLNATALGYYIKQAVAFETKAR